VNGGNLSAEFKDLILAMFSYDPEKRPTIDQIRAHPWLNNGAFDMEATRQSLLTQMAAKQQPTSARADKPMTKPVKVKRAAAH